MYNSILHCALVLHIVGACVKQKTLICASRQRFLHQVVDKEEVCLWRQPHRQGLWNSGGLWLYGLSGGTVTTLKKKSVHKLQLLFFSGWSQQFYFSPGPKKEKRKEAGLHVLCGLWKRTDIRFCAAADGPYQQICCFGETREEKLQPLVAVSRFHSKHNLAVWLLQHLFAWKLRTPSRRRRRIST